MTTAALALMASSAVAMAPAAQAAPVYGGTPFESGEVEGTGYYWWNSENSAAVPNWEGLYEMPASAGGGVAWCATVGAPVPESGTSWEERTLMMSDRVTPVPADVQEKLAYVIAEASEKVEHGTPQEVADYGAATAVIAHGWTQSPGTATYWSIDNALSRFQAGQDPYGIGVNPSNVPAVYDSLVENAEKYHGDWDLELDDVTGAHQVGDTVTVSGTLMTASGNPIGGHDVNLSATGGTLETAVAVTDSAGNFQVSLDVTATDVVVDAWRLAPAKTLYASHPTEWIGNYQPQDMIHLGEAAKVEADTKFNAVDLGTSARADWDHPNLSFQGGTIIDTVSYEGLIVGKEYTIKGELYNKDTGELTGITAEKTFEAPAASGSVDLEFDVNENYAGATLVAFEQLFDGDTKIADHEDPEDPEQTVKVYDKPSIGTTANVEGDNELVPYQGGTVIDTVAYENLVPGMEYTVKGELMNKADGKGTGIFGEETFTASESGNGTVDVKFTVPAGHAGTTLVVFEELSNEAEGVVAEHKDINDEAQTVGVDEEPSIGTSARPDWDNPLLSHKGGTIIDTVNYENLIPGKEYTLKGELYNKTTGELTGITAEKNFKPDTANGSTELEFTVPADYAGSTLVVFEQLFDGDAKIADHEDPEDPEQTVKVYEKPSIGTTANVEGDNELVPYQGGTVIDTVAYENLIPNTVYTVKGELMDKSTGEGTGIFGETTFETLAAEEGDHVNGTVDVTFEVPAGYAGTTLVVFEELSNEAEGVVAEHKDINDEAQTVGVEETPAPSIGTKAEAADGNKVPFKGGDVIDTVSYSNLEPETEYTLKGELMDKVTGEGTGIFGETTFTTGEAEEGELLVNGTVDVTFTVPEGHAGKDLVVFEYLYDIDTELVAEHTDIDDPAQTVTVEEGPSIGTSATDQEDGDRVLPHTGGTIVDVVTYENLYPETEYTLKGELMDKATGEGTGILGEATFTTPEAEEGETQVSGSTEVLFTVPEGYAGKDLVVFEYLYDIEGDLVAEHTDIHDEAQTVTVEDEPEKPTTPGTTVPETPGKPGKPDEPNGGLAQTGAAANFALIAGALALVAAGGGIALYARRRNNA